MPVFILSFVEGLLGPKFGKFAKPLIFAVLGLLILSALWGGKCAYDRSIIKAHDANQAAATAKADRAADNHAAEQRRVDDNRVATETQEINNAVSQAKREGGDPRSAYYKCVELQQRARAAKLVVPACS